MQLPLAIEFPEAATFSSFVPGPNLLLADLLKKVASGLGEQQVYLWSETGLGKTHLLQASCRVAAQHQLSSCYLPMSQLSSYGPGALLGLQAVHVLALDELELIAGDADWERALFSLINECRAAQAKLVLAANANINQLSWQLPDLISRLAWGPVFQIQEIDDKDKVVVLRGRAERRGIDLPDEVANYLLSRFPRDLPYLCQQLDTLDRASLAAQRRLTIPFIKQVLEKNH